MKTTDFIKLPAFRVAQNKALIPANDIAEELLMSYSNGEVVNLKDATKRDVKFHRAYFGLIYMIYDNLTPQFQKAVSKADFHVFLKELQGSYTITKVGKLEIKNYKSISFGRMSQEGFKTYIRVQLPFIYENVIHALYDTEMAKVIIDLIEEEWQKFLARL